MATKLSINAWLLNCQLKHGYKTVNKSLTICGC